MAENTSAGDYVKTPETVPPEKPVEDQLGELKIAAKSKIHDFVDKANQAANDPANKPFDQGKLQRDVDATAQDATNSYTKALTQLGEAFTTLESTGKQIAAQLGTVSGETAAGAQDLNVAAREHAQQRSEDAKQKVQGGQSAVQQGIAKVHGALSAGIAVANEKLQEGGATTATTTTSKDLNTQSSPTTTLLQSLGNVITSTAQSVREAFVTPSPTANTSHGTTPTSTNLPVTHPPAQSVSESLGQTAAALRDAVKETWSSPAQTGTPVTATSNKSLPGGGATDTE